MEQNDVHEAPLIVLPGAPPSMPNADRIVGELLLMAARTAHEANRVYCRSLGDDSQPPWDKAPDYIKMSAFHGAKEVLEHPSMTPEKSHENWLAYKTKEGWVYGETKDAEKKTHPCCLPFDELPADQRVKDELFTSVVKAVLHGIIEFGKVQA